MRYLFILLFAVFHYPVVLAQDIDNDTTAIAARLYMQSMARIERKYSSNDFRNSFAKVVDSLGLSENVTDLSDAESIVIDEPRFAYANITGISSFPTTKHKTVNAWIDMYDGNGSFFRKRLLIKGQGGYSLRFPKKNFSTQFCDENWTEASTPEFVIGDWVGQDGFHFKAFYTDFSRGIGEIGYKLFKQVVADRRPYWERGGYEKESIARCFPDGFPCAVYLNGEFYGLFAVQLKKHRKNMNMKKTVAEHVHIDGNLSNVNLFNGRISWTNFEVRNPKDLYTASNTTYNGNTPQELMGSDSKHYADSTDLAHVRMAKERTATVKEYVVLLSKYNSMLSTHEADGEEAFKEEFERCFDIESLIDYYVFYRMLMNGDGTLKNWQWFTYDGKKWMVTPYDLDQTFGITLYGFPRPATHSLEDIPTGPFVYFNKYYRQEECERYYELRDNGVFTAENINSIIEDWYDRIGEDWYSVEKARWPESPCYCQAICNAGWKVCNNWAIYAEVDAFSMSATYNSGDVCRLDGRLWEATATVRGVKPYIRNSDVDSLQRITQWVSDRLRVLDDYYGYDESSGIETPQISNGNKTIVGIYTLSGMKVGTMGKGINIVKYSDGSTRKVIVTLSGKP